MPNLENFSASGRAKALSNPVVRKCPILEVTEAKSRCRKAHSGRHVPFRLFHREWKGQFWD